MTRQKKTDSVKIRKAIADIVKNRPSDVSGKNNKPEQMKIVELLKNEYGLVATRQLVAKCLSEDLTKFTEIVNVHNNEKIQDIIQAMNIQKAIWMDKAIKPVDRTKAANAWRALQKQLIDYETQLTDESLRKKEIERPHYLIKIEPKSVKVTCPKCGHEFYDLPSNDDEDKEFFKSGNGQSSFDDFKEGNNDKKDNSKDKENN